MAPRSAATAGRRPARARPPARRLTPEAAAQAIYDAACAGRRQLLLGTTARLAWVVSRCSPRLYAALMKRRLQAEIAAVAPQGE